MTFDTHNDLYMALREIPIPDGDIDLTLDNWDEALLEKIIGRNFEAEDQRVLIINSKKVAGKPLHVSLIPRKVPLNKRDPNKTINRLLELQPGSLVEI